LIYLLDANTSLLDLKEDVNGSGLTVISLDIDDFRLAGV
jgi:hypothetical protein